MNTDSQQGVPRRMGKSGGMFWSLHPKPTQPPQPASVCVRQFCVLGLTLLLVVGLRFSICQVEVNSSNWYWAAFWGGLSEYAGGPGLWCSPWLEQHDPFLHSLQFVLVVFGATHSWH